MNTIFKHIALVIALMAATGCSTNEDNEVFTTAFTPGVSTKAAHQKYLELGGIDANGLWAGFKVTAISDLTWNEKGILENVILFLSPSPAPIPLKIKDKLTKICHAQDWQTNEQEGLLEYETENSKYKCSYQHFYKEKMYAVRITSK